MWRVHAKRLGSGGLAAKIAGFGLEGTK